MALDELCMAALASELRAALLGGKVDRLTQPEKNEFVLQMRGNGENVKLLLSAEPGYARAQLTALNRENPAQPPVLCMLLRKHLTGGRLTAITQPEGERILRFTFSCVSELGDPVERHLILEAMGRNTNLILTDGEDRVLAVTRRVEGDLATGKRQVMPGLFYRPPEPHPGIPPLLRRELEFRDKEPVEAGYARLREQVSRGECVPILLRKDGEMWDFTFLPILQYGPGVESVRYESFSTLFDVFYAAQEGERKARQRGGELLKSVQSLRERTARKLANQTRELEAAQDREHLRIKGDLLTSNLHLLHRGLTTVRLENYYDPDLTPMDIPLDPLLTPQQNAARYYRDYARAKTAEQMLQVQMAKGREDLEYLDSVLEAMTRAEGDRDILEIRAELEETGCLRRKKAAKKQMKTQSKPLEFRTGAGLRVSVGKNNTQNDRLTCKMAGKGDLWFHAQKTHGAHVILWTEGETPDDQSVLEAAQAAAWYSQARASGKTAVDYTPVRYIKKPQGAKPGMVTYTTYQTLMVEPKKPE